MLLLNILEKNEISTKDFHLCVLSRKSWSRMVSRPYYYYTTFWGPPCLMRLQETPPHSVTPCSVHSTCSWQWHRHQLLSYRGIKKCLVFDLKYRSLSSTFCAEVWTGAWWRISAWQTALQRLCCMLALCQSDRKTLHIPVREKSALQITLIFLFSPLIHQKTCEELAPSQRPLLIYLNLP